MRAVLALGLLLLVAACGPAEPVVTAAAPAAAPAPVSTSTSTAAGPSVPADLWHAVLVAGDSSSPAFGNGVDTMRDRLSGQGVRDISVLAADPASVHGAQLASARNVLGSLEVRRGGACLAFLTSHGTERGFFLRANRALMGPDLLEQALDQGCGSVPTVLIVSACHSGVFINAQSRKPNRIILTAASPERTSFGCGAEDEYTNYDRCLLRQLDGAATTWREVAAGTRACVERAERQMGVKPSLPQVFLGAEVADLRLPGR
jgi:hypothetical protein